jgi:hypothetical protein
MFSSEQPRSRERELLGARIQAIGGAVILLMFVGLWLARGHRPRSLGGLAMGAMFVAAGCARLMRLGTAPRIMRPAAFLFGAATVILIVVVLYDLVSQ